MTNGMEWIESSEATLGKINDTVWQYAETGLEEIRSSQFLAEVLREHGFTVESDIASRIKSEGERDERKRRRQS